jgi:hypothetical protein
VSLSPPSFSSMQSSAPNIHAANLNIHETRALRQDEDALPSYEIAVGVKDSARLPSYRRTLSTRFHPYKRPALKNIDDPLFVSITILKSFDIAVVQDFS